MRRSALVVAGLCWLSQLLMSAPALSAEAAVAAQQSAVTPDNERPLLTPPDKNNPTPVHVGLFVEDLRDVDAITSSFSFRGVLTNSWHDPRLAFDPAVEGVTEKIYYGEEALALAEKIWSPRSFPVNQVDQVQITERVFRIEPDGTVHGDANFGLRLAAKFDLRRFPFDQQQLTLEVESFSWDASQLVYVADDSTTGFDDEFEIPEWTIADVSAYEEKVSVVRSTEPFSRLVLTIDLDRQSGFYLWKILLPLLIIVALSWSVFWMVEDRFGMRVRVSATGILTIVAFQFVASQNLPRIGYLTLMDKVMVISFLLLAVTVLQSYIVSRFQDGHPQTALRIDVVSRWLFPLAYVALMSGVLLLA